MNFKILDTNNKAEVVALFTETFSSSEGEEEGRIIGNGGSTGTLAKIVTIPWGEKVTGTECLTDNRSSHGTIIESEEATMTHDELERKYLETTRRVEELWEETKKQGFKFLTILLKTIENIKIMIYTKR